MGAQRTEEYAAQALAAYPEEDVAVALATTLCEPDLGAHLRRACADALRKLVPSFPVDSWLVNDALAEKSRFFPALPDLLHLATACAQLKS